ncbi:MAG: Sec-independent protein translocase subunit TatA/TatB [Ardenticatenaceae bacterium]
MPVPSPIELVLIIVAIILVFGVGKLGDVGSALGRGIREFRQEVDAAKEPEKPKLEDGQRESEHSNI